MDVLHYTAPVTSHRPPPLPVERMARSASTRNVESPRKEEETLMVVNRAGIEAAVYVTVGKEVKEWRANLLWVLRNIPRSKKVIILHIHRPAKTIPFMGGWFSADQLGDQQVAAYRHAETEKMNKAMSAYLSVFSRQKVRAEKLIIEKDDVAEGIVMLVAQYGIKELVIGAAAEKQYTKKMKSPISKTALSVWQLADPSCKIWFICSGNLICTREALANGLNTMWSPPRPSSITSQSKNLSFTSSEEPVQSVELFSSPTPDVFDQRSRSARFDWNSGPANSASHYEEFGRISNSGSIVVDLWDGTPGRISPGSETSLLLTKKSKEDPPHSKGMTQHKEVENRHTRETFYAELQKQQDKTLEDIQIAKEQTAALEVQLMKSHRLITNFEDKLSEAHCLIFALEKELDGLQKERDKAVEEAKELRLRVAELENTVENFSKFSYSDLQETTNNFDESLKIGQGGYGSVYKGSLCHKTVAIKVLNPEGMQGKSEFYEEMETLSKLRHPNLVALIGACPEAWAIVYEFLPNGSLEDRLACKGNTMPLTWQVRARIAAEICSALNFLHSNKPLAVTHGNIKPSNILLDSNLMSKLTDFGIFRLLESNASTILSRCANHLGTFVYMDPEFLASGELRPCSDVYSFGIILLRLLTGKSALGIINEVHNALENEQLKDVLDPLAGEWPYEQAKQLAELGLRCCEIRRKSRPDLAREAWELLEPMMEAS